MQMQRLAEILMTYISDDMLHSAPSKALGLACEDRFSLLSTTLTKSPVKANEVGLQILKSPVPHECKWSHRRMTAIVVLMSQWLVA